MSKEYPVWTAADMAKIPAEALPRFLAELPDMLQMIREAQPLLDAMKQDPLVIDSFIKGFIWCDDNKTGCTGVSLHVQFTEGN